MHFNISLYLTNQRYTKPRTVGMTVLAVPNKVRCATTIQSRSLYKIHPETLSSTGAAGEERKLIIVFSHGLEWKTQHNYLLQKQHKLEQRGLNFIQHKHVELKPLNATDNTNNMPKKKQLTPQYY